MLARIQLLARPEFSLDTRALLDRLTSKPAQYVIAQAVMVLGYATMIVNPFDGDGMLLGLLCQATAIMLYVSSKSPASEARS